MKSRPWILAFLGAFLAVPLNASSQATDKAAASTATEGWRGAIFKVSAPKTVDVVGGALHGRGGSPPSGMRWVQLQVRLTPPKAGEAVETTKIVLVDQSSASHPAVAIAKVEAKPAFSFFGDATKPDFSGRTPAGFGLIDAQGEMTVAVMGASGGDPILAVQKKDSGRLLLLFAVPTAATKLHFQVDEGPRVAVP
ncbi:MAG: hypothetical protein M3547_04385 [Acidobacteriota bacterium]|nr:hypothetical protein [Acidobacteriota bacterium]